MKRRVTAACRLGAVSGSLMACLVANGLAESKHLSPEETASLIIRQVGGSWATRGDPDGYDETNYRCGGALEVNEVVREPDGKLRFITQVTDSQGNFPADESPSSGLIDYQQVSDNGLQLTICFRYDNEDRINDKGELAHWCVIMTGPDQYVWRERSWSFGEFTVARHRCKGPGA